MYRRVLVAIGGSPWSDAALSYAISIAAATWSDAALSYAISLPPGPT